MKIKTDSPYTAILFLITCQTAFAQTQPIGDSNLLSNNNSQTLTIKPKFALSETWIDNANLSSNNGNRSDFISQASPGINIIGNTGKSRIFFDYNLTHLKYSKSNYSTTQNSLRAISTIDPIENWLAVEASANISQQNLSAFGPQTPNSLGINNNTSETSTIRISPRLNGEAFGGTRYLLRYDRSITRVNSSASSSVDISNWTAQISGNSSFKSLNWSVILNNQLAEYSSGSESDIKKGSARLTYSVTDQFKMTGSSGWESNSFSNSNQSSGITYGYGFEWRPTERTTVLARRDHRPFGTGHTINFAHRLPFSSINFTDSRDISFSTNSTESAQRTVYEVYFNQFSDQIPDPVQRAAYVNNLLAQQGLDPAAQVQNSFFSSRSTLQRRQLLSILIQGSRNTLTVAINRGQTHSMYNSATATDDFSQVDSIRQNGFFINLSHKLSELTSFGALISLQENIGHGASALNTKTAFMQLNLTSKLAARTTGIISVRHTESDGSSSFTQNALVGTISYLY